MPSPCPFNKIKDNTEPPKCNLTESGDRPELDPYVCSEKVRLLKSDEFTDFTKSKDVVLVLFYHPGDKGSNWYTQHFKKASEITNRIQHAFATVDCVRDFQLCARENVPRFPHYSIYSRGQYVGSNSDVRTFLYNDMKTWVENVPVIEGGKVVYPEHCTLHKSKKKKAKVFKS